MNEMRHDKLEGYYRDAESWAEDRNAGLERSSRTAWWVAGGAASIALLEAIALVLLVPLKTVEPYTLLVDRQTGYVQALKPLSREIVAPDAALVRSFLVQYVIAREGFAFDTLQSDYRKVALWSAGDARERYIRGMQAGNPQSPLATLPRRAVQQVEIVSVSSLSASTSLVRFTTRRSDAGAPALTPQHWAAVLTWRFSGAEMTAADRLINPLGFQVTRYRKDAETAPEPAPVLIERATDGRQGVGRPVIVRRLPAQ